MRRCDAYVTEDGMNDADKRRCNAGGKHFEAWQVFDGRLVVGIWLCDEHAAESQAETGAA